MPEKVKTEDWPVIHYWLINGVQQQDATTTFTATDIRVHDIYYAADKTIILSVTLLMTYQTTYEIEVHLHPQPGWQLKQFQYGRVKDLFDSSYLSSQDTPTIGKKIPPQLLADWCDTIYSGKGDISANVLEHQGNFIIPAQTLKWGGGAATGQTATGQTATILIQKDNIEYALVLKEDVTPNTMGTRLTEFKAFKENDWVFIAKHSKGSVWNGSIDGRWIKKDRIGSWFEKACESYITDKKKEQETKKTQEKPPTTIGSAQSGTQ